MVTIQGSFSGSADIRVWEVDLGGDLKEIQKVVFPNSGSQFKVDPFGRFMVYPRLNSSPPVIDFYHIDASGELSLAQSVSRENWPFANRVNTLTPDASLYITQSECASSESLFYLEAFQIGSDMRLVENPSKLFIGPNGPFSTTTLGSVTVSGGHRLLHSAWVSGTGFITVYDVSASGEISLPDQQFSFTTQPINGTWAIRVDQRVVVTGQVPFGDLISYAVSPDGTLTERDRYCGDDGESVGSLSEFHPSGDSVVAGRGDVVRILMDPEGNFQEPPAAVGAEAPLGASKPAISPDGRIAVCLWDVDSQGVHWGVFALGDDGSMTMIRDHILNIGYRDIAFIPPRTEDILGDANGDGRRDIRDVVKLVNHLNGSQAITGPVPLARADATQDGAIDEDDLVWIVDFLLGRAP
jgi:hypothetical protein